MDGIDKVVTDEMRCERSQLEESLTFVLARILLLVQSSSIEPKHLAFFYNWCLFKAYRTVKTSGSICKIEPAFSFLPVDTIQIQQTLIFVSR